MRATKAQVLNAIHDPATTIIETRRQHTIVEAGGTVQGAFWLPSTTVYASQGAYRDLIAEAELDRYLQEIGADRAAHLVATWGGGVSATGVAMALYLHGYDNVAMYDGSWTEWQQDATTPKDDVATMLARSPGQPQ
jgi:thiosulfate/3-mercaptopyruvate sulfurtransferase